MDPMGLVSCASWRLTSFFLVAGYFSWTNLKANEISQKCIFQDDHDAICVCVYVSFITPRKINMEHNSLEVWKIMFLSKWEICRFQPLIFHGVDALIWIWFCQFERGVPEVRGRLTVVYVIFRFIDSFAGLCLVMSKWAIYDNFPY